MVEEKDRFYSRLAMIPGVRPLPSAGEWILLHIDRPTEVARQINGRLAPGSMSVLRQTSGVVRIAVGDRQTNERLLSALREVALDQFANPSASAMEQGVDSIPKLGSEGDALRLLIVPGGATAETITRVLSAISELHRAAGGLGLQFSADGNFAHAQEMEAVG